MFVFVQVYAGVMLGFLALACCMSCCLAGAAAGLGAPPPSDGGGGESGGGGARAGDSDVESPLMQQQPRRPRDGEGDAGATAAPAAERLEELRGLLDRGLIDEADYERKKADILDAL